MEQRIYYEDTDAGGIVYYANYLRYFERGRTEYLREKGILIRELHANGHLIVVMRLEIDYLIPAVLDDLIRIETHLLEITPATFTLGQQVIRVADEALLVDGKVALACLGSGNRARRLPAELLTVLKRGE